MNRSEREASIAWSKIVAGCVLRRENGEYLLVQEKYHKIYGLWNIPAGHVDKGEAIEHAAIREAKEESGYDVELVKKICIYHETVDSSVRHAFMARIVGGELKIRPEEILDAKWYSYAEIARMQLDGKIRAEWVYDAISRVELRPFEFA